MKQRGLLSIFLVFCSSICLSQTIYKYDALNRLAQASFNCEGDKYKYDLNGNRKSVTHVVIEITATVSNEKCGNDGQISIIPKDPSAKYVYKWSNGKTAAAIQNLSAGYYSLVITEQASGFICNR